MISWPGRMYFWISPPAVRIYDMSGSLVLRSGVGTQMMITSHSASLLKSVVAVSLPSLTHFCDVFARYVDDVRTAGVDLARLVFHRPQSQWR